MYPEIDCARVPEVQTFDVLQRDIVQAVIRVWSRFIGRAGYGRLCAFPLFSFRLKVLVK